LERPVGLDDENIKGAELALSEDELTELNGIG
jgi:hypothetical protein